MSDVQLTNIVIDRKSGRKAVLDAFGRTPDGKEIEKGFNEAWLRNFHAEEAKKHAAKSRRAKASGDTQEAEMQRLMAEHHRGMHAEHTGKAGTGKVKAHTRKSKSGKLSGVREHGRKTRTQYTKQLLLNVRGEGERFDRVHDRIKKFMARKGARFSHTRLGGQRGYVQHEFHFPDTVSDAKVHRYAKKMRKRYANVGKHEMMSGRNNWYQTT